jgi:hypothetical protein
LTTLDRDSLPEKVLHEINEQEGMGKELISIKVYDFDDDEINEQSWHLTFYEPFFSFEASECDNFTFVDVCYQKWPDSRIYIFYHRLSRGDMQEALKYKSKGQKESVA